MLTGQAKTDYQKEYMRRYRAKKSDSAVLSLKQGLEKAPESPRMDERPLVRPNIPPVRPIVLDLTARPEQAVHVRPVVLDPEPVTLDLIKLNARPKVVILEQSYNPMMAGYVPPTA